MLLKNVDDHSSVEEKCSENQPDTSAVPSLITLSVNEAIIDRQNNDKMNSNSQIANHGLQTTPDNKTDSTYNAIKLRKQMCPFDIDRSSETTYEDDLYVLEPRPAPHE